MQGLRLIIIGNIAHAVHGLPAGLSCIQQQVSSLLLLCLWTTSGHAGHAELHQFDLTLDVALPSVWVVVSCCAARCTALWSVEHSNTATEVLCLIDHQPCISLLSQVVGLYKKLGFVDDPKGIRGMAFQRKKKEKRLF